MNSGVTVQLVDGPLAEPVIDAPVGAGAVVLFEGRTRPLEGETEIGALRYEAYPPMTMLQLEALADRLRREHQLVSIHVEHSVGCVPVGQVSFRLIACAPHRKPALRAIDEFIDEMKRDVALWKLPVYTKTKVNAAERGRAVAR